MAGTLSRFGFWILLIFGLGFWAGRMSTARWKMEVVHETSAESLTSVTASQEVKRGARRAMENVASKLGFSPEQVSATTPIFIHAGREMAKLPKLSPERQHVFQRFYEQLQPHLTEQQKLRSKEILEAHLKQSPSA